MRSFLAILALLFLFNPCLAEEKTSHAVGPTRLAQNGSYMLLIFVSKNDRSIQGALVQVFNSTKKVIAKGNTEGGFFKATNLSSGTYRVAVTYDDSSTVKSATMSDQNAELEFVLTN